MKLLKNLFAVAPDREPAGRRSETRPSAPGNLFQSNRNHVPTTSPGPPAAPPRRRRLSEVLKPITYLDDPTPVLFSSYGKVTYLDWCRLEADRLRRAGRDVRVLRENGKVCVVQVLHPEPK